MDAADLDALEARYDRDREGNFDYEDFLSAVSAGRRQSLYRGMPDVHAAEKKASLYD